MDGMKLGVYSMTFDFTIDKQFFIFLCPNSPSTYIPDCDTVIAHIKLFQTDTRKYSKLCDYRIGLEPNDYLASYWPLTYESTELPVEWDEVDDKAKAKFRVKLHPGNIY